MRSLQIIEPQERMANRTMTAERSLQVGNDRMEKFLYAAENMLKWVEVNGKFLGPDNKALLVDEINDMHSRLIKAVERGGVKRFAGFKTG